MDEWARPVELDVFATGDTQLIAYDPEAEPSRTHDFQLIEHQPVEEPASIGDVVRRSGAAVLDLHARPGHRPGTPIATSSGRRTGRADIVRPVLVDPRRAVALASDDLFARPVAGLRLDHRQAEDDRRFLVWTGSLSGTHLGPVRVALHLLASPSLVVTVLELVPQERLRWHHRAFVRNGVIVIDALATRLGRLAATR